MRQQAVKAVREGATPADLAKAYGASERTIYAWLAAFASGGQSAVGQADLRPAAQAWPG